MTKYIIYLMISMRIEDIGRLAMNRTGCKDLQGDSGCALLLCFNWTFAQSIDQVTPVS